MQDMIQEDSLILKKRFLYICDNDLIAAWLLDIFENNEFTEGQRAQVERRDETTLLYTAEFLVKKLYNLFTASEIFDASHFLAKKRFIAMWWRDDKDQKPNTSRLFCVKYNDRFVKEFSQGYIKEQDQIKYAQRHQEDTVSSTPPRPAKVRKNRLEDKYKTEASRVALHNSRAIKLELPGTLTLEQWISTLAHFNWTCSYCKGKYTVLEHFVPLEHGKGTTQDNCVPACHSCNSTKGPYHPSQITDSILVTGIGNIHQYFASLENEVQ